MSDRNAEARTNGSGQSVNVMVGGEGIRWLVVILLLSIGVSAFSLAEAYSANEEASRAMSQADLANWTMMNLEGLMEQHGIPVPENLRPRNATKGHR